MTSSDKNKVIELIANPILALGFFVFAMASIPFNDSLIKLMSDRFSIFQILGVRAAMVLAILALTPIVWSAIKRVAFLTWLKLFGRGLCLVGAMLFFFLPLASLSLAEVTAIFYTAPLLISLLSVPLLGEKLGIYRILCVVIGMVGVLVIVRPGSDGFQVAYLMPILSATSYAAFQIITRYLRDEAEVSAMVVAQNLIYFVTGCLGMLILYLVNPVVPDGEIWQFLMRPWNMPSLNEIGMLFVCALIVLNLSIASSNVYKNVEATLIAPFEYVALPMAVLWGIVIWGDWPDLTAWVGIGLILASGVFMIWRENLHEKTVVSSVPMRAAATNATAEVDEELLQDYEPMP